MKFTLTMMLFALLALPVFAEELFESDVIKTAVGDLEIFFIGHGTLMMKFAGKTIYVDPYSKLADFSKLPKADAILITHEHQDHLDAAAIDMIRKKETDVTVTENAAEKISGGTIMKNSNVRTVKGIRIEAVPAYNLVHKRESGRPYHPIGRGNGYVLTFGDKRVYIAGDTENIPEMKALKNIDIAFLPMNLPYTMTPEMAADAARSFKPKVLYPYHYGESDTRKIVQLLADLKTTEVRIRRMK